MKYRFDGWNWMVRLEKGEKLIEQLTALVEKEQIGSAWIIGLGGAAWAELGFYDLPNKKYNWQKINEPLEITSLQGNIARDESGEVMLHAHGSFSRADMSALGGHVKELEVSGTCEIFLHRWQKDVLTRTQDEQIGLKLLDL